MKEAMQLPLGWAWTTVGQVTVSLKNGIYKERQYYADAGTPCLRMYNIDDGRLVLQDLKYLTLSKEEIEEYGLIAGDVVVNRVNSRELVGKACVIPEGVGPLVFESKNIRLRSVSQVIDARFLNYRLLFAGRTYFSQNAQQTVGMASVNQEQLSNFPVPLPPLNEQRRVVAKIEELLSDLDASVAALERARANLKRYRAAVLKAAVEGRLTAEWREQHGDAEPASKLLERILAERRRRWEAEQEARFAAAAKTPPKGWREKYVEPTPPETAGLTELPQGWCWANLSQLLHGIEGGKSFKCLTRPALISEWGVIKVSAMTWGRFLEEENKAIPPESDIDPENEIRGGDILLSRSNTTELVGASVLVGQCRPKLLMSDKSLRLLLSELVNRPWFQKALRSPLARRQLSKMATGTSDSMRNVSQEKIESVIVPLPPVAEQAVIEDEIEFRLSLIDAAEHQVEGDLKRATRLRQSILKRAFEGKLVPQDPHDEPASALLDRIRAERHAVSDTQASPKPRRPRRPQP